jgi:hypothetical protein
MVLERICISHAEEKKYRTSRPQRAWWRLKDSGFRVNVKTHMTQKK